MKCYEGHETGFDKLNIYFYILRMARLATRMHTTRRTNWRGFLLRFKRRSKPVDVA